MIRAAVIAASAILGVPMVAAAPIVLPEGAARNVMRDGGSVAAGPAGTGDVPLIVLTGRTTTEAWQVPGEASTEAILAAIAEQLRGSGWRTVFSCETRACGGFDFRFGLPVTPEPDMHVSLGDFRYLAARLGDRAVGVLVSRSAAAAHVEITRIEPAADPVTPLPTQAEAPTTAAVPAADPDDLIASLLLQGHVALDDLDFATGAATLTDGAHASLAALAEFLAAEPEARLTLVGHTDNEGALAANIALSRRRAEDAAGVLVSRFGADRRRIAAEGAGWLAPRATNATPEGRQLNRRVEAVLN